MSRRPFNRIVVELGFFFLLPCLLSALFYVRIAVRLVSQSRRAGRNRVLTVAFALSWVAWVFFWLPNIAFMAHKPLLDYEYYYFADEYYYSDMWQPYSTYAKSFRIPFQLFYSHLNPLLYLLVLKNSNSTI